MGNGATGLAIKLYRKGPAGNFTAGAAFLAVVATLAPVLVAACSANGQRIARPSWVRVPAENHGDEWFFTGEGTGATEGEAAASAVASARAAAATTRGTAIEADLRSVAQYASLESDRGATRFTSEFVSQRITQRTDAALSGATQLGAAHVESLPAGGFRAFARIRMATLTLFPARAIAQAVRDSSDLVEVARELSLQGERPLAEYALRLQAQAGSHSAAQRASVELAWLLQRDGYQAEATRWLDAAALDEQTPTSLQESASRLRRLLSESLPPFRTVARQILESAVSAPPAQRLAARLLHPLPQRTARDSAQADILVEVRGRAMTLTLVWLDTQSVWTEVVELGAMIREGVLVVTAFAPPGVGLVTLVVVGAPVPPENRSGPAGHPGRHLVARMFEDPQSDRESAEGLAALAEWLRRALDSGGAVSTPAIGRR